MRQADNVPFTRDDKGSYVLILHLAEHRQVQIGKLGRFHFPGGYYAYVGSALGPGGLAQRLNHHLRPLNRLHWHIDYLRGVAPVQVLWLAPGEERREHAWAAALRQLPDAAIPVPRFGASDCTCASHLLHYPHWPSLWSFRALIEAQFPGDMPIQAVQAETFRG